MGKIPLFMEENTSGEKKAEFPLVEEPKKEVYYGKTNNSWKVVSVVAILLLLVVLGTGFSFNFGGVSEDEAGERAVGFVNNLLQGQAVAELVESSQEYGLYKFSLDIDGEIVDAYISPDGRYFFAQPVDLDLMEQLQGLADPIVTPVDDPDVFDIEEPDLEGLDLE